MVVEFPGLGAPQNVANAAPTQKIFHSASHASTIMSQAEKPEGGSFFASVLDCITFIPRKIWGFIQMLFCCCRSEQLLSFADQLLKDTEAAAKRTIAMLEEKGFEEGFKSLEKALANVFLIPANKEALEKVEDWTEEVDKLAPQSANDDIKQKLMPALRILGDDLEFCQKIPENVRQRPENAAQEVIELLKKGYDRGKGLLERGFAAVDPKTPEGIAWAKQNGKQFEAFAGELKAIVESWGRGNLSDTEQEIADKLKGDLEKIMEPFIAAVVD